ncbi:glycosyltransferase family 2 protein [Epilithonimonas xixisoli]|uniref:Glycosyltransferase involved in cell wall biosynthesis n=1 Tax=Epilithonimonas xixisoli TaxID=1476462 RepID=A0A4R8I740_9FLAO|nr:glycosyltransferase [Epilithonimonas xixisoli]TDX84742.1 glycosyltransferase involved in cell wall biosynthesis [Epilithonimonas xixisoli]
MKNPLISIIVPCYNQGKFLSECLQSVLEQTYQFWECIIVNDGSIDDTEDIAQKWILKDSRFRYISKQNAGLSAARNSGIDLALGKWILPLDADDKIGNQYLELAEKEFDKGYSIIYCNAEFFGIKTGHWDIAEFSLHNLSFNNVIFCSAFFQKSQWVDVQGYDTDLIYGLEDWEFWISLLKNGGNVLKLDYYGFFYRIKESSMLADLSDDRLRKMKTLIFKKHVDFFLDHQGSYHENLYLLKKLSPESEFLRKLYQSRLFRLMLKLKFFQ